MTVKLLIKTVINIYKNLQCGRRSHEARIFPVVCSGRTRSCGQKLEHRKVYTNMQVELIWSCGLSTVQVEKQFSNCYLLNFGKAGVCGEVLFCSLSWSSSSDA